MIKPLVSVVIPTYNMGVYLGQAVRSVQCQTYNKLEIIISNNHSTDNTPQVLQEFASDSRVHIVSPPVHLPMYGHFNFACGKAQGEIVKFLCADDLLMPTALEKIVECFLSYPNVGVVQCQGKCIDKEGIVVGDFSYLPRIGSGLWKGLYLIDELYPAADCCSPTNVAFRSKFLKAREGDGPFDSSLISADWDLLLRISFVADIFRLEDRLCLYRHVGYHTRRDTSYFLHDMLEITERHYLQRSREDKRAANALWQIRRHWSEGYLWWAAKKMLEGSPSLSLKVIKYLYHYKVFTKVFVYSFCHAPVFLLKRLRCRLEG